MLLVSIASAATVAAATLYYLTSRQTLKNSAALTSATVDKLNHSYDLLERISGGMNNLQQLLRLEDPDAIERTIQTLEANQKQSAVLLAGCNDAGAGVKTKFDALAGEEKKSLICSSRAKMARRTNDSCATPARWQALSWPKSASFIWKLNPGHNRN